MDVDRRSIEKMFRDLPVDNYNELVRVFGFNDEDRELLDLRYRDKLGFKATRETVAEELGISCSTLDRKIKAICSRVSKYAGKVAAII